MKLFLLILLNVTRLDLSVTIIIEAFIDYRSQLQINVFKVATPLSQRFSKQSLCLSITS